MDQISGEEKMVRTHEPVTAVTCMSAIALLYLFFLWNTGYLPFSWERKSAGGRDILFLCETGIFSAVVRGGYESGHGAYES